MDSAHGRGPRRQRRRDRVLTRAVFFDVDFTLIYPGPTFQAEGYRHACAAHGVEVDPSRFDEATAASSFILDEVEDQIYNHDLFVHYTASIIEHMGGRGEGVIDVARQIYEQWSINQHFEIYDDVTPALTALQRMGLTVGVISNSHRSLDAFCAHFALHHVISVSISSAEHGYMKPHRSIFDAALSRAGVTPAEAMMVGDSLKHDIEGALAIGMRAVLLRRSGELPPDLPANLPVITTLSDLPILLP